MGSSQGMHSKLLSAAALSVLTVASLCSNQAGARLSYGEACGRETHWVGHSPALPSVSSRRYLRLCATFQTTIVGGGADGHQVEALLASAHLLTGESHGVRVRGQDHF